MPGVRLGGRWYRQDKVEAVGAINRSAKAWSKTGHVTRSWVKHGIYINPAAPPPLIGPAFRHHRRPAAPSSPSTSVLDDLVAELVDLHAVEPVPFKAKRAVISPIFPVPKASGGFRLVVNLKRANQYFPAPPPFRLPSALEVQRIRLPGDLALQTDMTSGYHQLRVHPAMRRYFTFVHGGKHYQFVVLPFGWSWAPYIFHRVMQVPVRMMRRAGLRVSNYLDDLLLLTNDPAQKDLFLSILSRLGIVLNPLKTGAALSPVVTWLGFTFDLREGTFCLTPQRLARVKQAVGSALRAAADGRVHVRTLAKAIGSLSAARLPCPAVVPYIRPLYAHLPRSKTAWKFMRLRLPPPLISDLRTALMRVAQARPRPLLHYDEEADLSLSFAAPRVFSDASDFGFGAVYSDANQRLELAAAIPPVMRNHFIHVKELYAVLVALRKFSDVIAGRLLRVYVDNNTALSYLVKRGGRIPLLNRITRSICDLLANLGARALFLRVPSGENPADAPSRAHRIWAPSPKGASSVADLLSRLSHTPVTVVCRGHMDAPWSHQTYDRDPASLLWAPAASEIVRVAHHLVRVGGYLLTPAWSAARFAPILSALAHKVLRRVRPDTLSDTRVDVWAFRGPQSRC